MSCVRRHRKHPHRLTTTTPTTPTPTPPPNQQNTLVWSIHSFIPNVVCLPVCLPACLSANQPEER
ncbi:hypothetical protein K504DRAFT_465903 [Pleomassaria siparia CBS 279.74]|uniref:Uncharacterized protein n=1 Tax=Pleomassaria siparia CBS 279.74 TaxID=1314801 RepID=A0A6G1KDA5_9PLEO|nr:hypothetical protein K504DRAFT_465903 [Pleomassaria siparia CBS 279.74]